MAVKRRNPPQFNLSFLDIMCCGFGAVVLLVMLLNGEMLASREQVVDDLRAEVIRLEREVKAGREYLVTLQNSMLQTDDELVRTVGLSRQVLDSLSRTRSELARLQGKSQALRKHINALQADLLKLDEEGQRIGAQQQDQLDRGSQVRQFIGQGDRQYLTGLRLGGKRTLILVDASASMLDETIVNIIIRRNLDERTRRTAPKWQRTLRTVEWLAANLPVNSSLQIYTFTTKATPVDENLNSWVNVKNQTQVNRMITALRQTVPGGGTSLHQAFAAAARMSPRPDNILLLTDGLPTQADKKPSRATVSGEQRLELFGDAVTRLPRGVPVNTILFPMEGDPMAAVSFRRLALETGGSFLTPTRDWP